MVIKKINLGGKITMTNQIDTFEMLQIKLEKDINKIGNFGVAQMQLEKAASKMNLDPNILDYKLLLPWLRHKEFPQQHTSRSSRQKELSLHPS